MFSWLKVLSNIGIETNPYLTVIPFRRPLIKAPPLLRGHYPIPRGWPLNKGWSVLGCSLNSRFHWHAVKKRKRKLFPQKTYLQHAPDMLLLPHRWSYWPRQQLLLRNACHGCNRNQDKKERFSNLLGRIVRKPVNVNPGLNFNWSITFSHLKMFFTSNFWCSLRLLQFKTEGQTL